MTPPVKQFARTLLRTRRLWNSSIWYKSQNYLITGIPGNLLRDFILIRLVPLAPIDREISHLRLSLSAFGILSLLFTSSLGMLLASKVLHPIRELAEGVKAVRENRLKHRIPSQDPDELGDLSNLFNQMLESLEEMSTAKVVQEALFPQTPLAVGEYRVFGISWPCTQLGGDYFDYLPLGPQKLFVLIGDVTGHGVPAALVMAMSKSLVSSWAKKETPPRQILENLNQIIHETVYAKKHIFMSLSALFIDGNTHEATLFNCGHPYPFHRKATGGIEMISASGAPPLGIRGKFTTVPISIKLEPGDAMIFYTDGLAESMPGDKSDQKFSLLKTYVGNRPHLPIEASPLDIMKNHPFILSGESQPDDFTVVVVERLSSEMKPG